MNILQEIDSVLYYENIEKFWHKYKYAILGALVLIFASVAGFNYYNQAVYNSSVKDSKIIINLLNKQNSFSNYVETLKKSLEQVSTTQGKEFISLELAKEYKKQKNTKLFKETAKKLNSAENELIKNISIYMLAEHYSLNNPEETINYINSVKQKNTAFNYSLVQELKANALIQQGKEKEAKKLLQTLIQENVLPNALQKRINIKLGQLK